MSCIDSTVRPVSCTPLASETAFLPSPNNLLLRRLAGSLAHHVNNALTGVIGYLELGLRQGPTGSSLEEHLRASLACAYQAADAVKRIVAFAFRATVVEAFGPVSLRALAEQTAAELRQQLPANITLEVAATGPGRVWACEPLLRRTIDHLAGNALEAMPQGGLLRLRVEEGPGRHCLAIRDTGEGLPPEVRAHLFEPFLTTKTTGHLGLGLVLCREMTEAQGGMIEIASKPSEGTEVVISFPALAEEATQPRPLTRFAS